MYLILNGINQFHQFCNYDVTDCLDSSKNYGLDCIVRGAQIDRLDSSYSPI